MSNYTSNGRLYYIYFNIIDRNNMCLCVRVCMFMCFFIFTSSLYSPDLGDAKENWLQHLQEQALSKKRAQKEQKGHGGSPGMPAGDYFESGLREGSSGIASTKNSKCSTPRTPEKLIKSPFSALLDSSFITPTLVLSHCE